MIQDTVDTAAKTVVSRHTGASAGERLAGAPLALVTGASSGIGRAFAHRLASEGYDVVVTARRAERLDELVAELRSTGRHATVAGVDRDGPLPHCAVVLDLLDHDAVQRLTAAVAAHRPSPDGIGAVDVLVNCAGFSQPGRYQRLDWSDHRRALTLMLERPMELTHALLPGMVAEGRGTIVNVSSIAAFLPAPKTATYATVKTALRAWTESLAAELSGTGVTATVTCPGYTRTEIHDTDANQHLRRQIPGWMWLTAEQVVDEAWDAARRGRVVNTPGRVYRLTLPFLRSRLARTAWRRLTRRR